MKTLFITPSLSRLWGGTTAAVLNSFCALSEQDVDMSIWSTRRDDDEIADNVAQHPKIRFFDSYTSWRYSPELAVALQERIREFDIVHIHGMWLYPHFAAAKAAKKLNVPYIISPHGMVEADALARKALKKRLYWELIEKHSFQNASAIHAITENEAAQVARLVSSKHTFVIPNGIETLSHNPKVAFPKEPTILFIGRLHPIKGLDRLMMAIADLDVRLLVAGDGEAEYKKHIYDLVGKLNIGKKVEFLGFVDKEQKKVLYEKASFVCVPSHSEVLSLVALEAISHGLPVLISKACHFDDIKRHGAGIVIEDNEPTTIKEGIRLILALDSSKLSEKSYSLSKDFSLEIVSSRLLLEYEKILQASK
jgi:glycosyltransferase involved in cell wall biosynthesis